MLGFFPFKLKQAKEAAEEAKTVAEAANKSKDRFLANISHELRTPLNSIIGYNLLVRQDKDLKPTHSEHLKIVEKSSVYLSNLINDLLDISRSQVDRITLYPKDLKLESFLNEVVDLVRMSAKEKNLTLKSEYNDLPGSISIDDKRLRQILLNLLTNAIKFTSTGFVTLKVSAIEYIENNNDSVSLQKLRFEVCDTGVGMSNEDAEKIFQPFEQVGDLEYRSAGAGLGLAIASELVKLMPGQLQVKSQLGIGSTFWFDLVVRVVAKQKADVPKTLPTEIINSDRVNAKILVVDDKQVNRDLLVKMLKPKGFEVITANNGQEMLKIAAEIKPDLILLDLYMPVKTGFTSAKELRQDPQLRNIPFIVVTASSITDEMTAYLDCDDILHKPIEEKKLLILMHKYLFQKDPSSLQNLSG